MGGQSELWLSEQVLLELKVRGLRSHGKRWPHNTWILACQEHIFWGKEGNGLPGSGSHLLEEAISGQVVGSLILLFLA